MLICLSEVRVYFCYFFLGKKLLLSYFFEGGGVVRGKESIMCIFYNFCEFCVECLNSFLDLLFFGLFRK